MDSNAQFLNHVPWLSAPLVVVSGAFFAWRILRWCSDPTRLPLRARMRRNRMQLRDMLFPECPNDPIYSKINEIEQGRCVQNTKWMFRVFHAYNAYMMVSVIWRQVQGSDAEPLENVLGFFLSYLICFVFDVFSCLITIRSLRLLVVAPVVIYIWNLLGQVQDWDELEFTRYIAFGVLWRMGASILYTDFPMVVGLNLTASLVCYSVSPYEQAQQLEFFGLAMILVSTCQSKRVRVAEIRATLEATTSRNFLDAMDALLSNICDVVLHLSSDFRISKPSPRFATMLFKSSPQALKGDMILDFTTDSREARRVAAFLNRADDSAAVVHTCFKDSHHSPVKVQLFHARGLDMNDEPFHVLGVLESEETHMPAPATEEDPFKSMVPLADTIKEGEVSSVTSTEISGHMGAKLVWVDHLADGIPIVKSSAGFAALGGPCSPGDKFLDSVRNKEDFLWQLRQSINGKDYEEVFQLRFGLPYKGRGIRTVHANVGVEPVEFNGRCISKLKIMNVRKPRSHGFLSETSSVAESRPRLWSSERTPPRSVERQPLVGPEDSLSRVDGANCILLSLNAFDSRLEVVDVNNYGSRVGFRIEVGESLLDNFTEPEPLKYSILGSLFHSTDTHEVRKFLEDESLNLEAYILCFRPIDIGRFVLCESTGGPPRDSNVVEVVVLNFFTYNDGRSLCCTVALSHLRQTVHI